MAEALALFKQATILTTNAVEELSACDDTPQSQFDDLVQLESDISGAKCHAEALRYLSTTIHATPVIPNGNSRNLLERLYDYDAGTGTDGEHRNYRLSDIPPKPQPIPCKPSFFDVALNHVGISDDIQLEKEMEKLMDGYQREKSASTTGGYLMGWFTGKR